MISDSPNQNGLPRERAAGRRPHVASSDPARPPAQARRDISNEERERLLDEELNETFPASDPPSWTMGGSHVSTLHH